MYREGTCSHFTLFAVKPVSPVNVLRNHKWFVIFTCWWRWQIHWPDSLWKISHFSTEFGFYSVDVVSESLNLTLSASFFLYVQAGKLSTLQPVWRRWNECFGGSEVFVLWLWTAAEGYSNTCLIATNQQRPQRKGGDEARSLFLRQWKTHISIIYILLYLKEWEVLFLYEIP